MIRILKYLFWTITGLLFGFAIFILYSSLTEYRPQKETVIFKAEKYTPLADSSIYSILTWNIGYAGLGAGMDFFYDGGQRVRDTKDNTLLNLKGIGDFLKSNDTIDFILLQEVDLGSKRSYYIYEKEHFDLLLPQSSGYFGINYKVNFVPVPFNNPMGMVRSGIVTYSSHDPQLVTRFSYPGSFPWPKSIYFLKRCFLESRYTLSNGNQFILINTHNSAFDDGSIRTVEINYLQEYVLEEFKKGNYVLIGGDWNQTPANYTPHYNQPFDTIDICYLPKNFLPDWKFSYAEDLPTNRRLQSGYDEQKTLTTLIDFFIASPNVNILSNQVVDLNFRNSDHQPVLLTFKFEK